MHNGDSPKWNYGQIVWIEASSNGRSCEDHDVCGSILAEDVVVRLRKVQIVNAKGKEETAIAAYWVSDGIDCCRVGFLQRHLIKHCKYYDGAERDILMKSPTKQKKNRHNVGCCLAAIISSLPPELPTTAVLTRHKRHKTIEDEDPYDKPGNYDDKDDENANDNEDELQQDE